jgi:hypothetical protein
MNLRSKKGKQEFVNEYYRITGRNELNTTFDSVINWVKAQLIITGKTTVTVPSFETISKNPEIIRDVFLGKVKNKSGAGRPKTGLETKAKIIHLRVTNQEFKTYEKIGGSVWFRETLALFRKNVGD